MKAYIGNYPKWVGPYQIAEWLQYLCVNGRDRDVFADWLSETWVNDFCQWLHSKMRQNVYIKTDRWDCWNADVTMAMLCLPILKDLRRVKHGAPHIDNEDVPEELRTYLLPSEENDYHVDDNHFKRFDWVLNEIIWSLEQMQPDCDWEDQFHTGKMDITFEKLEGSKYSELKHGPKHTHKFDMEGYKTHSAKIDNGLRLFGKYWRGLWD